MRLVAHTGQWRAPVVDVVEYRTGPDGSRYALVELTDRYPSRGHTVERALFELTVRP